MQNNSVYITFNGAAVAAAYVMLGLSLWLAPINLSTKGYWAPTRRSAGSRRPRTRRSFRNMSPRIDRQASKRKPASKGAGFLPRYPFALSRASIFTPSPFGPETKRAPRDSRMRRNRRTIVSGQSVLPFSKRVTASPETSASRARSRTDMTTPARAMRRCRPNR